MSEKNDVTVAKTIIDQMGGTGRLKAMINARDYFYSATHVQFTFSGNRRANKCIITLDWTDTYTMEIGKMTRKCEWKSIYHQSGLYWDMLKPVFEKATGLYLSL
jgi:hypothetical protein